MNLKKLIVIVVTALFLFSAWTAVLAGPAMGEKPTDTGNGNPSDDGVLENEGDWFIAQEDEEWYNDTQIIVNGNIFIEGSLYLRNVTLRMNPGDDGEFSLVVNETGKLQAQESNFTSENFEYHYKFIINGSAEISNSTISKLWALDSIPYTGGIQVYSEDVLIRDCEIQYNMETGFFITENITIKNVVVHNSTFAMVLSDASPIIEDSNFTSLWDSCIYLFGDSNAHVINCFLLPNDKDVTTKNYGYDSSVHVSGYMDIGVLYANMSGVPGANIFCESQNGGMYYNFTTDETGWTRGNLMTKYIETKDGKQTKNPYDAIASKGLVQNNSVLDLGDNEELEIVLFGEGFGFSSSAGDVNGDGLMDYVIGAPYNSGKRDMGGAFYLYYGSYSKRLQEFVPLDADEVTYGSVDDGLFGYSLDLETDYNLDGQTDLIVGAPGMNDGRGKIFIYYGGQEFNPKSPDFALQLDDATALGKTLSSGDIDNDDMTDVAISDDSMGFIFYGSGAIPKSINMGDHEDDEGTPETDFTSGVNSTGNSIGFGGDVDGWDWLEGSSAYGRSNQDMTTMKGGPKGHGIADGATDDESGRLEVEVGGRTNEVMDSGAWGIKFYVSSELVNDTQKDRNLFFQFKWEAYDRQAFYGDGGTEEYCYIKARITNPTGSFLLGEDYGGHQDEDKPNVYSHVSYRQRSPWDDSGAFSQDITPFLDGEGWYYLDFGAKFDARYDRQGDGEGIRAYFDNIFLYLSSAPLDVSVAQRDILINGNFNDDDYEDGIINTGSSVLFYYGSENGFTFIPELELVESEDFGEGDFDDTMMEGGKLQLARSLSIPNGNFENGWTDWNQMDNKQSKNNAEWELTTVEHGDWQVNSGATASFGSHKDYISGGQSDCDGLLQSDPFAITEDMDALRFWHHAKWASFEDTATQSGIADEIELLLMKDSDDSVIYAERYGPDHGTGGNGEQDGYITWDTSTLTGEDVYIKVEISTNGGNSDNGLVQIDQIEIVGSPYFSQGNFTSVVATTEGMEGFMVECLKDETEGEVTIKYRTSTADDWDSAQEIENLQVVDIPSGTTQLQVRVNLKTSDEEKTPGFQNLVLYSYKSDNSLPTILDLGPDAASYSKLGFNTHAGDWNGDGIDDIAVGRPLEDQILIFPGGSGLPGQNFVPADALVTISGDADTGFGTSLDFVGDVNDDGNAEILVGAPLSRGTRGALHLFANIGAGDYDLGDATHSFFGEEAAQRLGTTISYHIDTSSQARINAGWAELLNLFEEDSGISEVIVEEAAYPGMDTYIAGNVYNEGLGDMDARTLNLNITALENGTGSGNGIPYYYEDTESVPALAVGENYGFNFSWDVPAFEDIEYQVTLSFADSDYNPVNDKAILGIHSRFSKVGVETPTSSLTGVGSRESIFDLLLENFGSLGNDTVSLSYELPGGWGGMFYYNGTPTTELELVDSATLSFNVTPPYEEAAGSYPLKVIVTSENGWRTTELELDLQVLRPNLLVQDIAFFREDGVQAQGGLHLVEGETVQVRASLVNDGEVETLGGFYVSLHRDGELLTQLWTDSIEQGKTRTLDLPWEAESGSHDLTVTVDWTGLIPELDEGDNETTRSVTVKDRTPVGDYVIRGYVKNIYLEPAKDGLVFFNSSEWSGGENTSVSTDDEGYFELALLAGDYLDNQEIKVFAEKDEFNETKHMLIYSEDGEFWLNMTLRQFDILMDYAGDYSKYGDPGKSVKYLVDVTNTGNADDSLYLDLEDLPTGWDYLMSAQDLQAFGDGYILPLGVDETVTLEVKIIISANMEDAQANVLNEIQVKAVSTNASYISAELPIYTTVNPYSEIFLEFSQDQIYLAPFEEGTVEFSIENRGNAMRNVVLGVFGDYPEFATMEDSTLSLDIYGQEIVTLELYIDQVFDVDTVLTLGVGERGGAALDDFEIILTQYREFELPETLIQPRENDSVEFEKSGIPGQETMFETRFVNTGNVDLDLDFDLWFQNPQGKRSQRGDSEVVDIYLNGDLFESGMDFNLPIVKGTEEMLEVRFVLSLEAEKDSKFVFFANARAMDESEEHILRYANLSYVVEVGEYYNFSLENLGLRQDYQGFEEMEATVFVHDILVQNNGNMPDTPSFILEMDRTWDYEFIPEDAGRAETLFQPGESRNYRLVLMVPLDVLEDSFDMTLMVFSEEDPDFEASLALAFVLQGQDHNLVLGEVAMVVDTITMNREERPRYRYTVELFNTGNVSEGVQVTVYHKNIADWNLIVEEKELLLRPGESVMLHARLLLPEDVNGWLGNLSLEIHSETGNIYEKQLPKAPFGELKFSTGIVTEPTVNDPIILKPKLKPEFTPSEEIQVSWDMGNGDVVISREEFRYTYDRFGIFEIVCSIHDNLTGLETYLKKSVEIYNIGPDAEITITSRENASLPLFENITLSAVDSYDPDGEITEYSWVLNENIIGQGKYLTINFERKGMYIVNLEITDSGGLIDRTTLTIDVIDEIKPAEKPGDGDTGGEESDFFEENDEILEYISLGLLGIALLAFLVVLGLTMNKKKFQKETQDEIKEIETYLKKNENK